MKNRSQQMYKTPSSYHPEYPIHLILRFRKTVTSSQEIISSFESLPVKTFSMNAPYSWNRSFFSPLLKKMTSLPVSGKISNSQPAATESLPGNRDPSSETLWISRSERQQISP